MMHTRPVVTPGAITVPLQRAQAPAVLTGSPSSQEDVHPSSQSSEASAARREDETQALPQALEALATLNKPVSPEALKKAIREQSDRLRESGKHQQALMTEMAELVAKTPSGEPLLTNPLVAALNNKIMQALTRHEQQLGRSLQLTQQLLEKLPPENQKARQRYEQAVRLNEAQRAHIQADIANPEGFLDQLAQRARGVVTQESPTALRVREEQAAFARLLPQLPQSGE